MEVERLEAVLQATGLGTFQAQMQAADRATGGTKDQLRALAEISKVATEALKHVKVTAAQAAESDVSAQAILRGVKGIGEEARAAARHLDDVKLSQAQATETRIAADEEVRSLKKVEDQALKTRAATGGGGGRGGLGGVGLLGAAIGGGALLGPAAGPAALGLLAGIPVLASTGAGALGTLFLAFQGVTKAIGGNKKAFDDLGPSAQSFVLTIRSLDGWFDRLKQTAGAAVFPGLTAGLKAALSPGTVGAITQAITAFGKAIGDAGAQFGRYFGSSQFQQIFGSLMRSGAGNLSLLADAALRLFDAAGVLGRAFIPLVNWMVRGFDAASKWADSFVRAKDATGGLAGAMGQAKQSLQLVGNLFAALAKAVYELGAALYPVAKVAVKALTDGLNALAGWIERNRQTISNLVGGALKDLVAVVKLAATVVQAFAENSKKDLGPNGPLMLAIAGVGVAIGLLIGPWAVVATAAVVAVGEIIRHWATVRDFFKTLAQWILNAFDYVWTELQRGALKAALAMVEPFSHLPGVLGGWARKAKDNMQAELEKLQPPNMDWAQAALDAGVKTGQAWMAGFQSQAAAAAAGVPADTAAKAAHGAAMNPHNTSYNAKQVYSLLLNAGFSASDAANFVGIAKAESGLNYKALNNNAATGDYSVGLFQENFFKNLGPARTQRYAPMFGLSGNMSPQAFVAWLQQHPAAQATIAKDLFDSSGYSPWQGDAFIKSHPGLLNGTGGPATSPFGTPPPFTSGLGPKPKKPTKPVWTMPALFSAAMNHASANANRASNLSNTGSAAQRYLENELADLNTAEASLDKAIASDNGKHKARLTKAETEVENKIRDVRKLIADAIVVTGDALLPAKLRAKLKKGTAQFTADSDYAAVLTGKGADDYRKVLQKDLLTNAAVLQAEASSLKSKLATATGKQKAAIQAELAKVTNSLSSVQQSILSNLDANVQSLQSKVATIFGNVTQQFDDALAKMYFQNGAKTSLEQQLADMQAQDSLNSLNDSLQQAKDQLAQDQQGALAMVQFDAATGVTKNVYNPAAAKQLAADQKAIDAAQRQLEEYNLGIQAAQQRAGMDNLYAKQVAALNRKLADLADAFQNGTGSMQALRDLAKEYGIVINTENIPDFKSLASASGSLADALQSLADYIAKITGVAPKLPSGTTVTAGSWKGQVDGNGVPISAGFYGFDNNGKWVGPAFANGGPVRKTGLAMVHEGEYVMRKGAGGSGGGDTFVTLHVSALDPAQVDWGQIADRLQSELIRKQRRNAGTVGIK